VVPLGRGRRVAVAETLGAKSASPAALLVALFSTVNAGHPIVRGAARVAVVGAVLLVVTSLALVAVRARRFGRLEAGALMVLGIVSMGGSEWVREGLRKPWVIDRYMFVNGVRVAGRDGAAADDPFALDTLVRRGVLATSPWAAVPAAYRPGDPAFEGLPVSERAALEAEAGGEVFALECAACHTERAHLGVGGSDRRRAIGRPRRDGKPVADRRTKSWSDGSARRLGRSACRAGTDAEARPRGPLAPRGRRGAGEAVRPGDAEVFEQHCSACHGPDSAWPITDRLRGRGASDFYELIGRLPQVREEMPPFAWSEDERRALAQYLGGLAATVPGDASPLSRPETEEEP
jgi:mono/diheme cytochrome c family protein